jgi:hypothetical protein
MERVLTGEQWYHCTEYAAEVLVLASVLLIWWPAFKVSRALLTARDMGHLAARTSSPKIAALAGDLKADAEASTLKWNAVDYWMLLSGFICGAVSSLLKLFYLIPAAPH